MKIKGGNNHGAHYYNGKRNSRGKRTMSKLHRGINCGNVERAFKEIEERRAKEAASTEPNMYHI